MNRTFRLLTLGLLGLLGLSAVAAAAVPGSIARDPRTWHGSDTTATSEPATCVPGEAVTVLDANNVRATVHNNGALFSPAGAYEVPRGSGKSPIYTANLWVGGLVGGQLRLSASTYAHFGTDFEFFPGPLDETGLPPSPDDCSQYDRIWSVYRADVEQYQGTGEATDDLRDWPAHLGAPFVDANGDGVYDLDDGDFPELLGDKTLWWVMNDAAGPHLTTNAPALGLEVRVTASARAGEGVGVDHSTVYGYELIYRGDQPLTDAWVGFFVDPDLGFYGDDYAGSDSVRNVGFAYNADWVDEGDDGYGDPPPALGFDLFQGPRADDDGVDNDGDGTTDEPDERLEMTTFVVHTCCSGSAVLSSAMSYYNSLRGLWPDGSTITYGGDGCGGRGATTTRMYPGVPPGFWSEANIDGTGTRMIGGERRFILAAGPFSMQPGEVDEVVLGIVWARRANHLLSVDALKEATNVVQEAFGYGSDPALSPMAAPSSAPVLEVPADGAIDQPLNPTLWWQQMDESSYYEIELSPDPEFGSGVRSFGRSYDQYTLSKDELDPQTTYYWRMRGANRGGNGPWSAAWRFRTSDASIIEPEIGIAGEGAGIVEVAHPAGDPCGNAVEQSEGCETYGGDTVWQSPNSTGDYYVSSTFGDLSAVTTHIHKAVPRDFEMRFTDAGGWGVFVFEDTTCATTSFELWDIGIGTPGDPSDDRRMIPFLMSYGATVESWGYTTEPDPALGHPASHAVYWMDPDLEVPDAYQHFAAVCEQVSAGGVYPADSDGSQQGFFVDFHGGFVYPLARMTIVDLAGNGDPPPSGTIIRINTTKEEPPAAPVQSAPADGATVGLEPTLAWQGALGNRKTIQVARDNAFEDLVLDLSGLSSMRYTVPTLTPGMTYFWRVRAENLYGQSEWSDAWSFTVDAAVATEDEPAFPRHLELEQNYPNPFQLITSIRYGLPEPAFVRLEVFDILGRQVRALVNETQPPGRHEVTLDGAGLSGEVYFYRLEANGATKTGRMIRIR